MKTTKFSVTADHIKLLKHMWVSWEDCEFGAPSIDCKRPYGNSDVHDDMAEILGIKNTWRDTGEIPQNIVSWLDRLHSEMETVLQILVSNAKISVGAYEAEEYSNKWSKVK